MWTVTTDRDFADAGYLTSPVSQTSSHNAPIGRQTVRCHSAGAPKYKSTRESLFSIIPPSHPPLAALHARRFKIWLRFPKVILQLPEALSTVRTICNNDQLPFPAKLFNMGTSALSEFEHAYYIGNYLSGILYGVALVMYIMIMRSLLGGKNANFPRVNRFFAVYSTVLILLLTIDISCNAIWGEQMWITFRNGPGGVPGFIVAQTSVWYETLGSASGVAIIFMGDALLLYRLFIIYGSKYIVILLPSIAYLAAFSLAIIELVLAGRPGGNFFGGRTLNFGTPYYAIMISLNMIVTLLICLRLFQHKKTLGGALGKEQAKMYTSVASMLIESAAPCSLLGIMFLVPYARGDGVAIAFGQVWAKLTCISPQLIILRVVTGRAWSKEVVTQARSDAVFRTKPTHNLTSGIEVSSTIGFSSNVTTLTPSEKWNADKQSAKSLQSSTV